MEEFLKNFNKNLQEKLLSQQKESYERKNYSIIIQKDTQNLNLKESIKPLLNQQEQIPPFTLVEILVNDFDFELNLTKSNIIIYGEYQKLSREISQTKFFKKELRSVDDFTKELIRYFGCTKINFIGFGREDIDVQMVGYRPFLLEIINPTKNLNFNQLTLCLHKEIKIKNLKEVKKESKKLFQIKLEDKFKIYKALIFSKKMKEIKLEKITINQKTPLRVLHRRSNLVRIKEIEILKWEVKDSFCECVIKADAGTYIKEFINGDFGRTVPSISSFLECYADCIELDVLEIEPFELSSELIYKEIKFNII